MPKVQFHTRADFISLFLHRLASGSFQSLKIDNWRFLLISVEKIAMMTGAGIHTSDAAMVYECEDSNSLHPPQHINPMGHR